MWSWFEILFCWKVLLDIEDEVWVGWICFVKVIVIYFMKEIIIILDECDLGSSIVLYYWL